MSILKLFGGKQSYGKWLAGWLGGFDFSQDEFILAVFCQALFVSLKSQLSQKE